MKSYKPGDIYRTDVRYELADGTHHWVQRHIILWKSYGVLVAHAVATWGTSDVHAEYDGAPGPIGEPFRITLTPSGWYTDPASSITGVLQGQLESYLPRNYKFDNINSMTKHVDDRIYALENPLA